MTILRNGGSSSQQYGHDYYNIFDIFLRKIVPFDSLCDAG